MEKSALTQGGVYGIVLDTSNILMCCSVIDALIDVVTNVFWWEVVAEIIVCSLAGFLFVTMVRLMATTTLTSVSITAVAMGLLVAMNIVVPLMDII